MTLILTPEQNRAIREHAVRDYPGECCGALIGDLVGGGNYVAAAIPLRNKHEDGPERRFRIAVDDLFQVEKIARRDGRSVLGFYHSHPDAAAAPSQYDRDHAWEAYSYLIVEVSNGAAVTSRCWKLSPESGQFVEEQLLIDECILKKSAEASARTIEEII